MEVVEKIKNICLLKGSEGARPVKKVVHKFNGQLHHFIYLIAGLVTALMLWGNLIVPIVGFVYPAYMTYKAIETKGPDCTQLKEVLKNPDCSQITEMLKGVFGLGSSQFKEWLKYWVVYGFLVACEPIINIMFSGMYPLPILKVIVYISLFHPKTRYASEIYDRFLRDLLQKLVGQIDKYIE